MMEKWKQVAIEIGKVIRGQSHVVEQLLIAVLAGGHVLLEDRPGTGKTTLAKALAMSLDMRFSRIQFTPDLLPTDLLGTAVLNPRDGSFTFHEGPVFTHLLLADEVNRASPRTQSALLEAMNESQVTSDNTTRILEAPFFVVATQNPSDYQGTYPLPEAQLDRFMFRLSPGYPNASEELEILFDRRINDPLSRVPALLSRDDVIAAQALVRQVAVNKDVGRYIVRLIERTRQEPDLQLGASPRASLNLFRASQARAFIRDRDYVTPDDVQALFIEVVTHRIKLAAASRYGGITEEQVLAGIVSTEKVPV